MTSVASTIQRPAGPIAAATPKSLLRRPTLVRKREDDDDAPPSSPGKKAKVTFDSEVEVRVVSDWEKAPHIIQEEVRRAFAKRALGDDSGYDRLKDVYSRKKSDEEDFSHATIKNYTISLLANVSALNKSNSELVHAVLGSNWLGRSEDYVALFARFLVNLSSAQGLFLGDVVRMLVNNLTAGMSLFLKHWRPSLTCISTSIKWSSRRFARGHTLDGLCSSTQSSTILVTVDPFCRPHTFLYNDHRFPSSNRLKPLSCHLHTKPAQARRVFPGTTRRGASAYYGTPRQDRRSGTS